MGVQVVTLMWLRTTLTFQYRNGGSTRAALAALYKQGGILRFYQGLAPALLQGRSRAGDTAANAGVLALLDGDDRTRSLPTGVKSLASATVATAWRVGLMPLDTFKTILQVEGAKGAATLRAKLKAGGPGVLYHGSLGLCASAFLGHYVWYGVYNQADKSLPTHADLAPTLARNAALGWRLRRERHGHQLGARRQGFPPERADAGELRRGGGGRRQGRRRARIVRPRPRDAPRRERHSSVVLQRGVEVLAEAYGGGRETIGFRRISRRTQGEVNALSVTHFGPSCDASHNFSRRRPSEHDMPKRKKLSQIIFSGELPETSGEKRQGLFRRLRSDSR